MNREKFIKIAGISVSGLIIQSNPLLAMGEIAVKKFYFKDDGIMPNSAYPLLVYTNAFPLRGSKGADWLETIFARHNWTNTWRWGVYPFHHYHSNTHEVLGVFSGSALLHLGGEKGEKVNVQAGDIIVIPAGTGHKCISHSDDFTVVGAYPNGMVPDLNKGDKGERPKTDKNIAAVPFPATDPLFDKEGGLVEAWK